MAHRKAPKRRRPQAPRRRPRARRHADEQPDLMQTVQAALATGEPLSLLSLASTMLAAVDPRGRGPFGVSEESLTREQLLESLTGVAAAETSALLAAMAPMIEDDLTRARIRKELGRRQELDDRSLAAPPILAQFRGFHVTRCACHADILGDGESIMLEIDVPGLDPMTAMTYVDHNLGRLLKDAYVLPAGLNEVIEQIQTLSDDPDGVTRISELDPADARARLTAAIKLGAITFPPIETDTWPASRPLLEAVLRTLPAGGTPYEEREWSDRELRQIAGRFLASPCGAGFDSTVDREMLDSLLWFGSEYGPADPWHHSPASVEILLTDWIPRKVVAPPAELDRIPGLLRAFIRFCHGERGIPAFLTAETLDAVDDLEAEYHRSIRQKRPQGPEALIDAMMRMAAAGGPGGMAAELLGIGSDDEDPLLQIYRIQLDHLTRAVGGADALDGLDDAPLPDEDFDETGIPPDIRPGVAEVRAILDPQAERLGGHEFRTVCRRLLARMAAGDPQVFRRKAKAAPAAAAVCWIGAKANRLITHTAAGFTATALWERFGVTPANGRAHTLLKAGGFEDAGDALGRPDLLTSTTRRSIIERRDHYRAELAGR